VGATFKQVCATPWWRRDSIVCGLEAPSGTGVEETIDPEALLSASTSPTATLTRKFPSCRASA